MTRHEFDRLFAATDENTEGYSAAQLSAANEIAFAKCAELDADNMSDASIAKDILGRALTATEADQNE